MGNLGTPDFIRLQRWKAAFRQLSLRKPEIHKGFTLRAIRLRFRSSI
jgi:hypothetical protein